VGISGQSPTKEDTSAIAIEIQDSLLQDYFARYDFDRSGTLNSNNELSQLTTNLIFQLCREGQMRVSSDIASQIESKMPKEELTDDNAWSPAQFAEWFRTTLLPSLKVDKPKIEPKTQDLLDELDREKRKLKASQTAVKSLREIFKDTLIQKEKELADSKHAVDDDTRMVGDHLVSAEPSSPKPYVVSPRSRSPSPKSTRRRQGTPTPSPKCSRTADASPRSTGTARKFQMMQRSKSQGQDRTPRIESVSKRNSASPEAQEAQT